MKKNYKVGDLFEIELDAWEGPVVYMYTLMNVSNEYMLARYDDITCVTENTQQLTIYLMILMKILVF